MMALYRSLPALLTLAFLFALWARSSRRFRGAWDVLQLRASVRAFFEKPKPDTSRVCPLCRGNAPMLVGFVGENGSTKGDPALWECHTCWMCFDESGQAFGKRRQCTKCHHRETPDGSESCGCVVLVKAPCCATVDRSDGTPKVVGRCAYDGPQSLTWNPTFDEGDARGPMPATPANVVVSHGKDSST